MSLSGILGLLGDTLTFTGAVILALDALWREREFMRQKQMINMIKSLREVRLILHGIELVDSESANRVFIRQSVLRSVWGAAFLVLGFVCLLVARLIEMFHHIGNHCLQ